MTREEATKAELSCRISSAIVFYFERRFGRVRMEEGYAGIEGAPPLSYIRDLNNWVSFDFVVRLLDVFAEASGDPDFALNAGRFTISPDSFGFVYYMIRALATPRRAYQRMISMVPNANRVGEFAIDGLTDRDMVLRYHSRRVEPSLNICLMRQGQLSEVPTMWGLPRARLVHAQCQTRGAEACVYELSWLPHSAVLPAILAGGLAGVGASVLLLWRRFRPWDSSAVGLAVGGAMGLALACRTRSARASKLLADQDESLALSVRDLGRRFDEIKQLNQTLEQKVAARTQDLSLASARLNASLERQVELFESEKRARVEAEHANRAKDLFLATLSHELRTPLTTLLMQSNILARLAPPDSRLERGLVVIRRAVEAQARLIDDLLDVSRIVSGKLVLNFESFDLAGVVRIAVQICRPAAEGKSLNLEAAIDESVGTVHGDAARFQQIVGNLLTNAIKFTPPGGRVGVRVRRVEGKAQIEVSDTGLGIRADVLPQLFNRFVQADSSITRTFGGLGLGLAIVRHLVEAHGGEVRAESPGEGKGATFRVTVPLSSAQPRRTIRPDSRAAPDVSGLRVLLVEDDDDARDSFALILRQLGAEVRAVASAAAGMAALKKFKPLVILSDVAMPGEDGLSFIRQVRWLPPEQGGRVPAAALTALAGEEDRRRAMEAGFQLHLPKPIDATRLVEAVARLASWNGRDATLARHV